MKKIKVITLPDGSVMIDGLSKLLVVTPNMAKMFETNFLERYCRRNKTIDQLEEFQKLDFTFGNESWGYNFICKSTLFTTKKGREAIRIDVGSTHIIGYDSGSGDRSWNGWKERKPANAFFAEAAATSNGGGCWTEVIIMEKGVSFITSEQDSYMKEVGE